MQFGLNNIWLGTEESLGNIMRLSERLQNPTKEAMMFFGEEEDSEPTYEGIGAHLIQVEDGIGILNVKGSLTNEYSFWNKYFGVVSYDEIRDAAISLANDDGVKEIVLSVDSGGGAAHGLNEVAQVIKKIDAQVKPVHGYTSTCAFSAGMWLASSGRDLTAAQISEVGSIGVIITMQSYHDMYKKAGIDVEVIRAGKYKALGHPTEKISEEAIKIYEAKAEKMYGYFLEAMVENRPALSITTKDAWAEGKTFFADEALAMGMIDKIEHFDTTVANLSKNHNNTEQQAHFAATEHTTEDSNAMGTKTLLKDEKALAAAASGAALSEDDVVEEEVEAEEVETEEVEETTEDDDNAPEADAQQPEASTNLSEMLTTITTLSGDNAKLQTSLEQSRTTITNLEANVEALKPIACTAINRLQIALGQTPTDLTSLDASAVADMFAKVNKNFEASFSMGGPKSERLAEAREEAENVSAFCPIHKS